MRLSDALQARRYSRGLTYLWLLFFVAGMGTGLSLMATMWHTQSVRENEQELLFVGNQIRRAIATYYEETPDGKPKQFPESLENLLEDKRGVVTRRHLRRLYQDPITNSPLWGLIKTPDGARIMGIYSLSTRVPMKRAGFAERFAHFASANQYGDWKFVHVAGSGTKEDAQSNVAVTPPQTPEGDPGVSVGGLPGTSVPTTSASSTTPPPTEKPKPPNRCDSIAASDKESCDALGRRFDAETRQQCLDSARARAQACAEGKTSLPGLYIRY